MTRIITHQEETHYELAANSESLEFWKTLGGPLEKVCGYRSTIKILFCPFIKLNNG